jgi:hypothetical protein
MEKIYPIGFTGCNVIKLPYLVGDSEGFDTNLLKNAMASGVVDFSEDFLGNVGRVKF